MAITCTPIRNDLGALASVIDGFNGIDVDTVETEEGIVGLDLLDSDSNLIASFNKLLDGGDSRIRFEAYLAFGIYESVAIPVNIDSGHIVFTEKGINNAWKCSNGIILDCWYNDDRSYVAIVKSNNGKTAFVGSDAPSSATKMYSNLFCVCYGDVGSSSDPDNKRFYTFSPRTRTTSIVVPLPSRGAYGSPSYTYKSGIMLFNDHYSLDDYGETVINNKHFLTNSYFAIEDENLTS